MAMQGMATTQTRISEPGSRRALLVTFSGLDGAGKSTQIAVAIRHYKTHGMRPKVLWSRGGYTSGVEVVKRQVRRLFGDKLPPSGKNQERTKAFGKPWVRKMWLAAAMLDLMRVYGIVVRWWLLNGRPVICDRYLHDTLIDFETNYPGENIEKWILWKVLEWFSPRPDVAFYLYLPVSDAKERAMQKGELFLSNDSTMHERSTRYSQLAEREKWITIDSIKPINEVTDMINYHLKFDQ